MSHHNQLDRFASCGLKAQAAVDAVIENSRKDSATPHSEIRTPKFPQRLVASSPKSGPTDTRTTTAGTPPVAATQGKRDASGSPPDSPASRPGLSACGNGALSQEITVQQIRWSDDQPWLTRLMVDRDRPPWIRQAAQMRLRKLGRRKPRL